jgi:hypothetical protein
MNEIYLIALMNLVLCTASGFVCICRLNAMERRSRRVRWSVQAEYAIGLGAMIASAGRPLIGEWPGYASLCVSVYVLWALLASRRAWRGDRAPDVATDRSPLGGC